jgi:hypothetical protein
MRIDLKQVEQDLTPEKVIELVTGLGADRYDERNDYIIFPTICHNADSSEAKMKLYYYKRNHKFHCYTDCGENFNIYQLFEKRYQLLDIQYDFYKDIILKIADGVNFAALENGFDFKYKSLEDRYIRQETVVEIKPISKRLLNVFQFYATSEWLSDGISEETMRVFNILYDVLHNKIIIPHYDIDDNLIGIRGRALNDEDLVLGKYMPVKIEGKYYAHPLGYNLYGLNVVKDNIKAYKMAIIAEAEKSCMQSETMFGPDRNIVVAACGSTIHKYQIDLLIKCGAEKILLAFDKEGETWKEQCEYFDKLKSLCSKYKNYVTMGFTFDNSGLLKLKQSPFDCGPEVATKLISKGVWL